MRYILALLIGLMTTQLQAQVPNEFKDLVWNRYVTENFEIVSIDDTQGKYLYDNLENIKTWIYNHWGLSDLEFKRKCIIVCVPTDDMFEKFFHRTDVDPKYDKDTSVIWVSLDSKTKGNWLKTVVSEKLTHICLQEFSEKYELKFPPWMIYGISALNSDPKYVSDIISKNDLISDAGQYINGGLSSKQVFETTFDDIKSKTQEDKDKFKAQSAVLVLFLKKELTEGRVKFVDVIKSNGNYQKSLAMYGFQNTDDFEGKYRNYFFNLVYDIKKDRTPRSYFTWFEK